MKTKLVLALAVLCTLTAAACEAQQPQEIIAVPAQVEYHSPGVIFQPSEEAEENLIRVYAEGFDGLAKPVQAVEVSLAEGATPELIVPNGCLGVLVGEDGEGWPCAAGDVLCWSLEKYPHAQIEHQTLLVGTICNGGMSEPQPFDDLSVSFEVELEDTGTCAVYFMGASSDPIALGAGALTIN